MTSKGVFVLWLCIIGTSDGNILNGFSKLPPELQQRSYRFKQNQGFQPQFVNQPNFVQMYQYPSNFYPQMQFRKPSYQAYQYVQPDYMEQVYYENSLPDSPTSNCNPLSPAGVCNNPWITSQQGYHYDPSSGGCQPVTYGGCGLANGNLYNDLQICMASCEQPGIQEPCDGCEYEVDDWISTGDDCGNELGCEETFEETHSVIVELNEVNFDEMIKITPLIMVDFYSPDCKACIKFAPIFEEVATYFKNNNLGVVFAKVDLDKNPQLKARFGIETYPRLILWDNIKYPGYSFPRRYFKKFGLVAHTFILWIKNSIASNPGFPWCTLEEHCCEMGGCVSFEKVCDGIYQCGDGTDETYCANEETSTTTITPTITTSTTTQKYVQEGECDLTSQFECDDGMCLSLDMRCDGVSQCNDKRDEMNCKTDSSCDLSTNFQCDDGRCLKLSYYCDGITHCDDGKDEANCSSNGTKVVCDSETDFVCNDGLACVDLRRRCDGYPDCSDSSDEDETMCPEIPCNADWQFHCIDHKRCIDRRRQCDGYDDCKDASDEQNCLEYECNYWQWKCGGDGICIDTRRKCDGITDCLDGSDEIGCFNTATPSPTPPTTSMFTTTEETITSTSDIFNEYEEESTEKPSSVSTTTESLLTTTTTLNTTTDCPSVCTFIYDPVCGSDGKTYSNECFLKVAICQPTRGDVPELKLDYKGQCIQPSFPEDLFPDTEISEPSSCNTNEFQCNNGKCIPKSVYCNKVNDCSDGEDELFCDNEEDYYDYMCYSGRLVKVIKVCVELPLCFEYEDNFDCQDYPYISEYLESNVGGRMYNSLCVHIKQLAEQKVAKNGTTPAQAESLCDPLDEFQCKSGDCILASQQCDKIIDCDDESDEFDCGGLSLPQSTTTTITTTTSTTTSTTTVTERSSTPLFDSEDDDDYDSSQNFVGSDYVTDSPSPTNSEDDTEEDEDDDFDDFS